MQTAWPLVGRAEELDLVVRALRGGEGAGIVVAGPAGVGKTGLARDAAAMLQGECAADWVAATSASSFVPFGGYAQVLGDLGASKAADRSALVTRAAADLVPRGGTSRP